MPYKSKKQMRFFFSQEGKGKLPKGTAKRWAKHTPNTKDLPEEAKKEKAAFTDRHVSIAVSKYAQVASPSRKYVKALKEAESSGLSRLEALDAADRAIFKNEKEEFYKAADAYAEKVGAAYWAKKLANKYKKQGKTVPEWLNRLVDTRSDKEAFDKTAFPGSLLRLGRATKSIPTGLVKRLRGGFKNRRPLFTRRPRKDMSSFEPNNLPTKYRWEEFSPSNMPRKSLGVNEQMYRFKPGPGKAVRQGPPQRAAGTPAFSGADAPIGKQVSPQRGFMRRNLGRVGTALKWGVPLGSAGSIGYLLGQNNVGQDAAEQLQIGQDSNKDLIQRGMGSLGDYVSEDLGIEGLGNMIKENPYASLGVGAGGGGILMYLLYRLLSGGFGGQQPQSRATMY